MTLSATTEQLIDRGNGPDAIVLLHGWCCRTEDFSAQIEALAPEHRVIAVDWQERMRLRKDGCSMEAIVGDLEDLLEERGARALTLCGHSMGAYLALRLAAAGRAEVGRLVVLDPTIPLAAEEKAAFRSWIPELVPERVAAFYRTVAAKQFSAPTRLARVPTRFWPRWPHGPAKRPRACWPAFANSTGCTTFPPSPRRFIMWLHPPIPARVRNSCTNSSREQLLSAFPREGIS